MRSTFKVLFYVNGSKEKNGIVPIMGRVTINGSVAQFSCKQSIHKDLWDVNGNRAKGKSKESRDINLALDNIKAQIIKHYQRISYREAFVTAEMVRNAYQGIGTEYETLLRAFDKENEAFAKQVGKDRSLSTYQKYLTVRKYLVEFIKAHYKRTDIAMNELAEDFIRDYCLYLRNEVGLAQSSVWIYSIPLKHIVTTAHYNGKIARNPFAQYKVDPDHKERGFLTEEELQSFTTIELNNPNWELARDLFVFGCWTGISFIDIKNLTTENITILGGSPWIVSKRQKTGVPFQIKLMDIPMQIIKRYKPYRISNNLFNIGSHDTINKRIKEVAKLCGIEKRTSFHLSRHTFAVLALNYGMPIESVSKILGHTNITTTQIYAKVTNTKLEHDISMFESRVCDRFAIYMYLGMERAVITISENGRVNIPSSNVWMSFTELVVLFDVAAPIQKAAIRAIHKSGVIAEHTQHCEVIPYTYWATLYNMDMIIALAFRIHSYGAEKIRSELLKRICGRKEKICYLFSLADAISGMSCWHTDKPINR